MNLIEKLRYAHKMNIIFFRIGGKFMLKVIPLVLRFVLSLHIPILSERVSHYVEHLYLDRTPFFT